MGSTERHAADLRRRLRLRYEWSRWWRASIGFAPVWAVVASAAWLGQRPTWALSAGSVVYLAGVILLWRGRELRRAVLPGLGVGMLPLALALAANAMGHVCLGERCTSLCLPACACGGVLAGWAVTRFAQRRGYGKRFWLGASTLAVSTGAMGCACVGLAGFAGLGLGYASGLVAAFARASLAAERQ